MMRDIWTVARKEWQEVFMPDGSLAGGAWSEGLIVVGALGVFIALQIGPDWITSEVALYWLWLPLLQMTGMIAESVAGERERRTLETLLTSRLDDRSILFGKLLAALAYGWVLTLLSLGLGVVTVSVVYGHGTVLLYSPALGVSVLGLALLGGLFVALVGVLISLSAPTVRQAYQRLSIALLLAFLPLFGTQYLPAAWREQILPTEQNWFLVALAAASVLLLVDGWLLAHVMARFRRPVLMTRY
jgi:ABC-2 type transport system permease protein